MNSALYVHKFNPSIFQDVNDVEAFGFLSTGYNWPYFLAVTDMT
jgi:hypothetical protein